MTLKQKIHSHYRQLVQDRIDAFRDMIANLSEDAQNDAKGSAGDKHETALSMMHIEQEKLTQKLREFLDQKAVLEKINPESSSSKIVLGSLVKANGIHLFVSAALPKVSVDGIAVIALSPQSPLGSKLLGTESGHSFEIGNTRYLVESIS
ncbi:MAG: hypothetical protein EOO48_05290 [Flavobacterium sp.]|nr:MAG: hypothetical protein EOO48_05290 [Flavobacterium sp.]